MPRIFDDSEYFEQVKMQRFNKKKVNNMGGLGDDFDRGNCEDDCEDDCEDCECAVDTKTNVETDNVDKASYKMYSNAKYGTKNEGIKCVPIDCKQCIFFGRLDEENDENKPPYCQKKHVDLTGIIVTECKEYIDLKDRDTYQDKKKLDYVYDSISKHEGIIYDIHTTNENVKDRVANIHDAIAHAAKLSIYAGLLFIGLAVILFGGFINDVFLIDTVFTSSVIMCMLSIGITVLIFGMIMINVFADAFD